MLIFVLGVGCVHIPQGSSALFEASFEDQRTVDANWYTDARGSDAVFAYEPAVGRRGGKSVSIAASAPGTGWPGWFSSGYIPVDPESTYTLTAWGRAYEPALIWFGCFLFDENEKNVGGISTGSVPIRDSDGWKEMTLSISPRLKETFGEVASIRITLLISFAYNAYENFPIAAGSTTKVYFDDVSLVLE
jgi:hypothetical protein